MIRNSSRTLTAVLALVVLLAVALAAGCASTPSGPSATKTPTPSGTAAGTVTTTGTAGSGTAPVAAVGYARLIPFIPRTVGAWQLEGDPMGMTGTDSNGKEYSWVTGTFTKTGDDKVQASVQIHDLAVAESPLKQQWKSFTSYESTEGSMKSVTVKGQPAWEIYDKSQNNNELMAFVGDRYIVVVLVEDGSRADLDTFVNAIDFAGLAAVK